MTYQLGGDWAAWSFRERYRKRWRRRFNWVALIAAALVLAWFGGRMVLG